MSEVKSIGTILRELCPTMPYIRSYIKLCHKKIKDKQYDTYKYYFACDCKTTLVINEKSSCTGTATAH